MVLHIIRKEILYWLNEIAIPKFWKHKEKNLNFSKCPEQYLWRNSFLVKLQASCLQLY